MRPVDPALRYAQPSSVSPPTGRIRRRGPGRAARPPVRSGRSPTPCGPTLATSACWASTDQVGMATWSHCGGRRCSSHGSRRRQLRRHRRSPPERRSLPACPRRPSQPPRVAPRLLPPARRRDPAPSRKHRRSDSCAARWAPTGLGSACRGRPLGDRAMTDRRCRTGWSRRCRTGSTASSHRALAAELISWSRPAPGTAIGSVPRPRPSAPGPGARVLPSGCNATRTGTQPSGPQPAGPRPRLRPTPMATSDSRPNVAPR